MASFVVQDQPQYASEPKDIAMGIQSEISHYLNPLISKCKGGLRDDTTLERNLQAVKDQACHVLWLSPSMIDCDDIVCIRLMDLLLWKMLENNPSRR